MPSSAPITAGAIAASSVEAGLPVADAVVVRKGERRLYLMRNGVVLRSYKVALGLFAASFVMLGAVGAGITTEVIPEWFGASADVTTLENLFGRFWMVVYFGFFLFLWAYTYFGFEKTKPVPDRVTTHD